MPIIVNNVDQQMKNYTYYCSYIKYFLNFEGTMPTICDDVLNPTIHKIILVV